MTPAEAKVDAATEGLVSIVVAFYNAERFIAEAIDSVLAQTYRRWELLLVDDGSSDSGPEIVNRYAAQHAGRIHCLTHPNHKNLGVCTSRNLGIRHSRGQYIAILDSDDVWFPRKLENQIALMQLHPEVGMVYGHSEYWVDWRGDTQGAEKNQIPSLAPSRVYFPPELLRLCFPLGEFGSPCPSEFLIRRDVMRCVSGFVEALDRESIYEDQAFLAKIYLVAPVFVAGECWDRYRIHDNSCSAVSNRMGRSEVSRQLYFEWLERHLRDNQVQDKEVWRAYRRYTRSYRHPWIASVVRRILSTLRTSSRKSPGTNSS